jgi:hypothetical protein
LVCAQNFPTKNFANKYFGIAISCLQVSQHWLQKCIKFGSGALASQNIVNYLIKNQYFGHDKKIDRVCFGINPNTP